MLVAGQHADDGLALLAQQPDGTAQRRFLGPRRADRRPPAAGPHQAGEFLQVETEADRGPVAAEHGADLVVAAATQHRIARALRIDGEAGTAVVRIAADVGQIEADRRLRMRRLRMTGQPLEIVQRGADPGVRRQQPPRGFDHLEAAIQAEQVVQAATSGFRQLARRIQQSGGILGRQRREDGIALHAVARAAEHGAHDARIAEIERHLGEPGAAQAVEGQILDLEVGLEPRMAVDLGAELQAARASHGCRRAGCAAPGRNSTAGSRRPG